MQRSLSDKLSDTVKPVLYGSRIIQQFTAFMHAPGFNLKRLFVLEAEPVWA